MLSARYPLPPSYDAALAKLDSLDSSAQQGKRVGLCYSLPLGGLGMQAMLHQNMQALMASGVQHLSCSWDMEGISDRLLRARNGPTDVTDLTGF